MSADQQPIFLYDTLRREKVTFTPIDPDNVRMYVCGPTVYDYAHIGNARPIIVFDVLFRLLRHVYGADHVTYARNITDVDDKINARAAEEHSDLPLNDAIAEVTTRTTAQFHEDIKTLGVLEPTVEPTCTGHVPQMVSMIETLIKKECAYAAEGHVLLDTTKVPDYGKLSGRSLDEMIAGARVEVAPYKRNPADSVLWKPSTDAQPGWDSPWGRGRPGWHIECSAMAAQHLGEVFDIHGGGIDLAFPHHENELAQSRAAHDADRMANIWMHNGFLQVEGEKMSKSLGNFVTINELLATEAFGGRVWPGAVLRFAMLMTHYRQPIDWTVNRLEEASVALDSFREFSRAGDHTAPSPEVVDALCDDLNTPRVVAELYKLLAESKKTASSDQTKPGSAAHVLRASCEFLGIDLETVNLQKTARASLNIDDARIAALIQERLDARAAKNFARGDEIRDQLAGEGIQLKDGKDPATGQPITTWEVKR
ncbi:MAG: cysteine--tRNA ligase [Hyphomicrobiaceae bacterium]